MAEGISAYKRFMALKLHFTTDSYDFFKYRGKTRSITDEAFAKRKDEFHFRKLERRYPKDQDLIYFIVSNMVATKGKMWVGDLASSLAAEKTYAEWQKYIEAFLYNFKQDMLVVKELDTDYAKLWWNSDDGSHPQVLRAMLGNRIRIESLIAANKIVNFLPLWKETISDKYIWPDACRMMEKYDPFLTIDKAEIRKIMKEVFL